MVQSTSGSLSARTPRTVSAGTRAKEMPTTMTRTKSDDAEPRSLTRQVSEEYLGSNLMSAAGGPETKSQPDPDVPKLWSRKPQVARLGSPRRPVSAQIAFRRQARGAPLRGDVYVAPSISWALKLGIHPRALPLFPNRPTHHSKNNPSLILGEVLRSIVDLLSMHRAAEEVSGETMVSTVQTRHSRPKSPAGLEQFKRAQERETKNDPSIKRQKQVVDDSDSNMDVIGLERKIMDQARKFSLHLQDVWSGEIELSSSEVEVVNYVIKIRMIPMLDKRIMRLEEIIREMMPEGIQDLKETPQSLPRDLLSYEAELEKRNSALYAMQQDLRHITKKMIDMKQRNKLGDVEKKARALRLHRSTMTSGRQHSMKDVQSTAHSSMASEENSSWAQTILELMERGDADSQLKGIQHYELEGQKLHKYSPQIGAKLRDRCIECFFSPFMSVRKTATSLMEKKGLIFSDVPVEEIPQKPGAKDDADVFTKYEKKTADNALLSSLFSRAFCSNHEVQEALLCNIYKLVRIDDLKHMQQLYRFLQSPKQNVRLAAVKILARHAIGKNSLETFQQIAGLKKDSEWTIRCAICEALPNIAGLLRTLGGTEDDWDKNISRQVNAPARKRGAEKEDKEELSAEEIAEREAIRREVKQRFKLGMRQAVRYSRREKEMQSSTIAVLEELLVDESSNVRRNAIRIYSKVATPGKLESVKVVFRGCRDHSPLVREIAFKCLPSIVNRNPKLEVLKPDKYEKKATIEWLVGELVALMDPETALNSDPAAPWPEKMTPEFKQEIRRYALAALIGDDSDRFAVPGIVPKAHMTVMTGFTEHLQKNDVELQEAILQMMPHISTPSSENHEYALIPVVQSLGSSSDTIRHTAALILPRLIDPRHNVSVGRLVSLLGAGQHHELRSGPKRSAIAVLLQLQKASFSETTLRDETETLKKQKMLLTDIAFGLHSESHEFQKYDEESIMEPLMEIEAKTLDSYPDNVFVAKGLGCRLTPGLSGFDSGHWKRRLFLLNAKGELLMTRANTKEEPAHVFHSDSSFVPTRMSFGSIVPHAVKIQVTNDTTGHSSSGKETKDSTVLGFFTKDEANVWFRDFQSICHRNARRVAMEERKRELKSESLRQVEPDYIGRTAKSLENFMDKLMNPENVQNPGLAEKQLFVQGQLNKLLHDKEGFVRWAERAETHHTAMQPKKARPSHKEDEAYLHVKLDMVTFLALLRANDLYGKTGFTGFTDQAVRQAWKVANAGDGSEGNHSTDKDKLKLDWDEYQSCLRLLAKKAGVVLEGDVQEDAKTQKNEAAREAVGALLSKHWNDNHTFLKFAAGTTLGPNKTSAHILGGTHLKTMDYREFLGLCSQWKIFPSLLSKSALADIFKQANNSGEDSGDTGGHEFTFEEYKVAMIGIASALKLPIMSNGRNLASHLTFAVKKETQASTSLR